MNSFEQSGYQNSSDMNPNFEFNTSSTSKVGAEKPAFSSFSGVSRPRMVKIRKSSNSKSMNRSDTRNIDPGFNLFQPVSDNVSGVSSRIASDVLDGIGGKSGALDGDGVDRNDKSRYLRKLKSTNKVEKVGNELLDEIRKLRIENQSAGGQFDSSLNDSGSARFSKIELPSGGVGDVLPPKLPEELKRLNLGGSVSPMVSSGSPGGAHPVGGSFGTLAADLPNDLTRLNLRDGGEVGGRSFVFSTRSEKDFVFGSSGTSNRVADPSLHNSLADNLKSLNLEDQSKNGFQKINVSMSNQAFVSSEKGTASKVDTMVLDEMEKLNIGKNSEESSDNANPNGSLFSRRPADGGMGDCIKSNLRENSPQVGERGQHSSAPQVPEYNKGSVPAGVFSSSSSSHPSTGFYFQSVRGEYQVLCSDQSEKTGGFIFTGKQESPRMPNIQFRTPEPKENLFTGSNLKWGFNSEKGSVKVHPPKGRKGNLNQHNSVLVSLVKNVSTNEKTVQQEPSDSYSPMDISPCYENLDDAQSAGEPSLTSDYQASTASQAGLSDYAVDRDPASATERMDINEGDGLKDGEAKVQVPECTVDRFVNEASFIADCVSAAQGESFQSATENLDSDGESEVKSKCEAGSSDQSQYFSASSSISSGGSSFAFAASSSSHTQAPAAMRHHKKKNRINAGPEILIPHFTTPFSDATSSQQFSPVSRPSVLSLQVGQSDALSAAPAIGGSYLHIASPTSRALGGGNLEGTKKGVLSPTAAGEAKEACNKWRQRGNLAYTNGDLETAEDYYTQGLGCIPQNEKSKYCLRALVVCYSNRAATRMSLGRMREALQDCLLAAKLDQSFFRVQLRAANCYLALGEIGDASLYFKKLLQSTDVCVERNIIVEASEGLQKAQKVSECINRSGEFLIQRKSLDAELLLEVIDEALVLSPYSEQLLERKAETLLMLRRYEEVIQLCEQTLKAAEKNSSTLAAKECSSNLNVSEFLKCFSFRIWRYGCMFKSNFYLGKLEEAIDFLEKQENWRDMVAKYGSETFESLIPQLSTARELIRLKSAGNGAFQTGRHVEAVEYYTSALSFNVESRPFAAVSSGNRAAAYQALGHITDAVADCSLAIALDGNYLKAISRRATLFEMIRDYDQAAKDLQRLVSLLIKQVEEKADLVGASLPTGSVADLRHARQRLYHIEEQAKKEIPLNFYLILGVEKSVTAVDLKKAYRKAALRHHPDKAGQYLARGESGDGVLWKEIAEEVYKDADKLFKMIAEAYAVLSDPAKRSQYDIEEEMRNGQKKNGSSSSRMATDASSYAAERGGVGQQWREGWRSTANPYSRGFDPSYSRGFDPSADPYSRGFEPSRPGRYY